MWYCIPSRESRSFLFSSSFTNISGCLLLDNIPRISCTTIRWECITAMHAVVSIKHDIQGQAGQQAKIRSCQAMMLDPRCLLQCTAGHPPQCRHEKVGRHLAPCNDGAHEGPGVGHGEEVAVLRCRVPCQEPRIEEKRQLRFQERPCCVCLPAPCMSEWDVSAATSDHQPRRWWQSCAAYSGRIPLHAG